jgi:DNA mismatch repair protein MutL
MAVIAQLSQHVADMIAAGEVVERPASVVKELVENAIDAGAHNVTVEIQNGGMRFLRVTDDGCGMAAEDAPTAFLRHATSKLRTAEDLSAIGTLGFRGEALAAISAVSRIDLLTCQPGAAEGTALHLDGGVVTDNSPAGCPPGTTIIVRDLFYNTPARLKFMKRDSAEGAACFSVVQRQALAHPEISFRFLRDGEEQLLTSGDGELLSAIYAVLGRQSATEMVQVSSHWEKTTLTGYITRPTASRGNRNYQHFFVNGRYVKSKTLSAGLEEAYRNQLMQGRYPACVLHITMPTSMVDVNVHPAKTEVKFLSERDLFDCVHYGVLGALNQTPGRPQMRMQDPPLPVPDPNDPPAKKPDFYRTMSAKEYTTFAQQVAKTPNVTPSEPVRREIFHPTPKPSEPLTLHDSVPRMVPAPPPTPEPEPTPAPAPIPQSAPEPEPEPEQIALPETEPTAPEAKIEPYRIVGEVLRTYIIVEQGTNVYFLDKHAAHERVLFEKLRAQPRSVMPQLLLEPIAAELDQEEAAVLLDHLPLLADYGYEVEDFGGNAVLIRQIPSDIDSGDAVSALSAFAAALLESRELPETDRRDHLLHSIACKSAIKANWVTHPKEIEALVREVFSRDDIKYCPHGRPVCITLTKSQLERQFGRA